MGIPAFRFAGSWRGYQQRLIDELDRHLDDRRLHVVAAPGAGKTVIGLEVLRLLARPALILSPTLAIREQWLGRLGAMFAADDAGWLAGAGSDLAAPGWLVSSTYQSLHSALGDKDDGEEDDEEAAEEAAEAPGDETQSQEERARVPHRQPDRDPAL
jgi:superfamily II DNA or RNA helicase